MERRLAVGMYCGGYGDVGWPQNATAAPPPLLTVPQAGAARNTLRAQPSSAGDKQHGGPTTCSHQGILFVPILQLSSYWNPLPQPTMVPILLLSPISKAKQFPSPKATGHHACSQTTYFQNVFKTYSYNHSLQRIPSRRCPCLHRGSPGPSGEAGTTSAVPPPSLVCSAPAGPAPSRGVLLSPSLQQDPHLRSSLGVQSEQCWGGKRARQRGQGGQHLVEGTLCSTHSYLSPWRGSSLTLVLRIKGAASSSSLTSAKGNETGLCQPWVGTGEAPLGTLRTLTCLPVLLARGGLPGHGDLGLLCLVTGAHRRPFGHREHSGDVCLSEGVRAAAGEWLAVYPESRRSGAGRGSRQCASAARPVGSCAWR